MELALLGMILAGVLWACFCVTWLWVDRLRASRASRQLTHAVALNFRTTGQRPKPPADDAGPPKAA